MINYENQKVYETIVELLRKRKMTEIEYNLCDLSNVTETVLLRIKLSATITNINRLLYADILDAI